MSRDPRLVLHIGMHKTGSTSVQRFFARNRPLLRLLGITYPEARDASGKRLPKHNHLFHAISHEKDKGAPHPVLGSSAALIEKLAETVEGNGTTVISAEGLSGEDPAFANAFAPLRGRFPVRVVVFLRRQDDWAQSFYKQMVHSREVREARPFDAFLAGKSTRDHLDYAQLLDWWAAALGEDAIRVEIYKPCTPLLPVFLKAAGLPAWLAWLPFSRAKENQSPCSGYIERQRAANEAKIPRPASDPSDTNDPYFTEESRKRFMEPYDSANESIRARFRPDLKRLFD